MALDLFMLSASFLFRTASGKHFPWMHCKYLSCIENFCTFINYQYVDIKYTRDHEWVEFDKARKTATLGITDFAQKSLGDIVFVDLPQVGSFIKEKGYF